MTLKKISKQGSNFIKQSKRFERKIWTSIWTPSYVILSGSKRNCKLNKAVSTLYTYRLVEPKVGHDWLSSRFHGVITAVGTKYGKVCLEGTLRQQRL